MTSKSPSACRAALRVSSLLSAAILLAGAASAAPAPASSASTAAQGPTAAVAALSYSPDGLEERPAPGLAGGWAVHLGGRFHSVTAGRVDAQGCIRVVCDDAGAAPACEAAPEGDSHARG